MPLIGSNGWTAPVEPRDETMGAGTPRALARPGGLALVDEGLDALQRVGVHHVARHRPGGVLVSGLGAAFDLAVEERLAEGDRRTRLGDDRRDQRLDRAVEGLHRGDAIDEAAGARLVNLSLIHI